MAIRQLGLSQREVSVSYQGSVLESCALLRERFEETLRRQENRNVWSSHPDSNRLLGAYLLGRSAVGWAVDTKCWMILSEIYLCSVSVMFVDRHLFNEYDEPRNHTKQHEQECHSLNT